MGRRRLPGVVIVAPEVAARIAARRAAGESVADIGRSLHMTPGEVRTALRLEVSRFPHGPNLPH